MATLDEACGPPSERAFLCEPIYDLTGSAYSDEIASVVGRLISILVIVTIAFVAVRVLRYFIRRFALSLADGSSRDLLGRVKRKTGIAALESPSEQVPSVRRAQRAHTIGAVLRGVASVVVWTIAAFTILAELGISLGPLIAGAGIAGAALGFGAQSMVRDFLAGLFILIEDQYGVGDVVDLGDALGSPGTAGTVEEVTLRSTRVRDVSGVVWHVPNGEIHRAGNMSHEWSRALLDIDVAYDTDLAVAQREILDVARTMWEEPEWNALILSEPEVWGVEALASISIKIRLVVQTKPLEQWRVARELRERLKRRFDEVGIEIPFPPALAFPGDGG